MKNILIVESCLWNLGDEFIKLGVIHLFEEVFGKDHNHFLYNRNPEMINKPNILSNSLSYNELEHIDMVIIAGSPDWYDKSYKHLFPIIKQRNLPLLAIGIGSPFKDISLTPLEQEIYNRPNTYVICRDENVKLYVPKATTLPCPALFCSNVNEEQDNGKTLYIVQTEQTVNQHITGPTFQLLRNQLDSDDDIMCFYKSEWKWYNKQYKNVQYTYDAQDALRRISKYKNVVSTRLHGAIGALSCNVPAGIVVDDSNFRIMSTSKVIDILPILNNNINDVSNLASRDDIKQYKQQVKQKYIEVLNEWKKEISLVV